MTVAAPRRRWAYAVTRLARASAGLLALCCATPAFSATAVRAAPFGSEGQTAVFGRVSLELAIGDGKAPDRYASLQPSGSPTSRVGHDLTLDVTPGALHFFLRNLALGLSLSASYGAYQLVREPFSVAEFSAMPGIGFNLGLSETLGLFPQLWFGMGYSHVRLDPDGTVRGFDGAVVRASDVDLSGPFVVGELIVPLQLQLGPATYLSIGPRLRVRTALHRGFNAGRLGLTAGVGAFF